MESVSISKFIPGGQTLGQLSSGRKIFFWNALPGELVTAYEITKQKSHYAEAIATKIEHPSPDRILPADPCFLSTSPWQILNYETELLTKRELLIEQFRQAGLKDELPEISTVATDGRDLHYRNKMEYSLYFSHEDEKIHLAFHARGSHRKAPTERSSIERPELWAKATEIVAELNRQKADSRAYQSLLLRCDQSGHVEGGLFQNHQPHPRFANLEDALLGHTYSYSPNGFFQINLPVYEMVLQKIATHVETNKVLDLYSGVGSIGLSVAADRTLTLVECDKSAYTELEKNSAKVPGATPILAKSEEALDYITPDQTIILDPPRAGCHPALLDQLLEIKPPKIIYLSCNPATQARDLKILTSAYSIDTVQPYNFFPRTPHLENLVILSKKAGV